MFTELLEYLMSNKTLLIGAAATISELLVITFNTVRKIRASKKEIITMEAKPTRVQTILWSINPINCFRKA